MDVPYLQMPHELLSALCLFNSLNGTDWAVVMVVLAETTGRQRESVELGYEGFQRKIPVNEETVRRSVLRLGPAGHGILDFIREPTHTRARCYRVIQDWSIWNWRDDETFEAARASLSRFDRSRARQAPVYPAEVVALAGILHQQCRVLVPSADLPPQDPEDRVWQRWCRTMAGLLSRQVGTSPEIARANVNAVLAVALGDRFFSERVQGGGRQADQRLQKHWEELWVKATNPRRSR